MVKKESEKTIYIRQLHIFCLNMYGLKKEKSKIKKNWEIHTETIFCFAILALFFVIFAFMQKFEYMYFL